MGSMPRRARQPIPTSPYAPPAGHRGCAVLLLLGHLLLAQLTLGLAVVVHRDRPGQPVAAVVAGRPGRGRADLDAGDRAGARGGRVRGRARAASSATSAGGPAGGAEPPVGTVRGGRELAAGQLPIALIAGAAEAALIGWPGWRRTGQHGRLRRRVPACWRRCGRGLAAALIRAGGGGHQARLRARGRPGHRRGRGAALARDGGRGAGGGDRRPAGDGHQPAAGARRPAPPQAADRRRRQRRRRHRPRPGRGLRGDGHAAAARTRRRGSRPGHHRAVGGAAVRRLSRAGRPGLR